MKKIVSIILASFILAGCGFGEYAPKDDNKATSSTVDNEKRVYTFTKQGVENKTFYKAYKEDEKWKKQKYSFGVDVFYVDKNASSQQIPSGKYTIENGNIKLMLLGVNIYIKALNEDEEKLQILWTANKSELNKTESDEKVYFFKSEEKANNFIKK